MYIERDRGWRAKKKKTKEKKTRLSTELKIHQRTTVILYFGIVFVNIWELTVMSTLFHIWIHFRITINSFVSLILLPLSGDSEGAHGRIEMTCTELLVVAVLLVLVLLLVLVVVICKRRFATSSEVTKFYFSACILQCSKLCPNLQIFKLV